MEHRTRVERYPDTLSQLANDVADLRYDALAEFLVALAEKLHRDSVADARRSRYQLAAALQLASDSTSVAAQEIQIAWGICEPFMVTP